MEKNRSIYETGIFLKNYMQINTRVCGYLNASETKMEQPNKLTLTCKSLACNYRSASSALGSNSQYFLNYYKNIWFCLFFVKTETKSKPKTDLAI